MKKILIIAPYGFNDRMTNFIEFVTARLLAEHNWEVAAVARSDNRIDRVEHISGITVYRYSTTLAGIIRCINLIRVFRPSIIHFHTQRNNRVGMVIAMLAKALHIPLLFTEYGLLHDHYLTDHRSDPLNRPIKTENVIKSLRSAIAKSLKNPARSWQFFKNYIFHWPLAHADWRIFVSHHNLPIAQAIGLTNLFYRSQIADDARWKIKVNDDSDSEKNRVAEEKLDLIKNSTAVLFVGSTDRRKGWDVLIEAIAQTDSQLVPYCLIVMSSSDAMPEMVEQKIKENNIEERIIYIGRITDSELLRKIYQASQIVAIPSRYEGFGLATIEAFEMKKPIVASNVEALTESLKDGLNALLVPPNDPKALAQALERLAGDNNLRDSLSRGGQATLERIKSAELKLAWLELYESILAGKTPAESDLTILPK